MDEKVTVDIIICWLKEKVESKQVQFDSKFFIESALKLNVLLGDEQDKLVDLEVKLAERENMLTDQQAKKNISEIKSRVKVCSEYAEWKKQDLKCGRVEEYIKICKKMSDRASGY